MAHRESMACGREIFNNATESPKGSVELGAQKWPADQMIGGPDGSIDYQDASADTTALPAVWSEGIA
jgi:hypothetical protein